MTQLELEKKQTCEGLLAKDLYDAALNDDFTFFCVWGPPRSSKTTLAGWMLYSLYKDWNKVLLALAFDLSQVIYRLREGLPERWWTRNGFHHRVPGVVWDDFGLKSNKAETQYDKSFDLFKGGFDALGTKLANLIITLVDPNEPTLQLVSKYSHEIQVVRKGHYKYDVVEWEQNYHGFKTRVKKHHRENGTFQPWPSEVYREYDQIRMSLCDETFQRIDDATVLNSLDAALHLIRDEDVELLHLIQRKGPISHYIANKELGTNAKDILVRNKSRGLVMPLLRGTNNYDVELTTLGRQVLAALNKDKDI